MVSTIKNNQSESSKTKQRLTVDQLDYAISILDIELQKNRLSKFQHRSYKLLLIFVCYYVFSIILGVFLSIFTPLKMVGYFFIGSAELCGGLGLFVLLANLHLIIKNMRQRKLIKKMGLFDILEKQWQTYRKKGVILSIVIMIGTILGIISLFTGIVGIIMSAYGKVMITYIHILFIVNGVVLIFTRFVRGFKQRLDFYTNLQQLQSAFAEYQNQARQTTEKIVEIDNKDYNQIAQIEQRQIAIKQSEIIEQYKKKADISPYSVFKSDAAVKKLKMLALSERAPIELQIGDLVVNPKPKGVSRDVSTGLLGLKIPKTLYEILYRTDESTRLIEITDIKRSSVVNDSTNTVPLGE